MPRALRKQEISLEELKSFPAIGHRSLYPPIYAGSLGLGVQIPNRQGGLRHPDGKGFSLNFSGRFDWEMIYECRIYNKKGKFKKIISSQKSHKELNEKFFAQNSTKRATGFIGTFKDGSTKYKKSTLFQFKKCIYCEKDFFPRQRSCKYCSHECQKDFLRDKKRKKVKS